MQKLIGQNVKVIAGKHAGRQGKLLSISYAQESEEANVKVTHKTWLRFFHFLSIITVKPSELAAA
jgi:ribosomal protein L25 (general stress protein Ctc)